uniref:Uncharacterized protein n=1 Tax=Trichogramma kaykai TaxID=54128 RepID=A0ABD2VVS4_9HYME
MLHWSYCETVDSRQLRCIGVIYADFLILPLAYYKFLTRDRRGTNVCILKACDSRRIMLVRRKIFIAKTESGERASALDLTDYVPPLCQPIYWRTHTTLTRTNALTFSSRFQIFLSFSQRDRKEEEKKKIAKNRRQVLVASTTGARALRASSSGTDRDRRSGIRIRNEDSRITGVSQLSAHCCTYATTAQTTPSKKTCHRGRRRARAMRPQRSASLQLRRYVYKQQQQRRDLCNIPYLFASRRPRARYILVNTRLQRRRLQQQQASGSIIVFSCRR